MLVSIKRQIHDILEDSPASGLGARFVSLFLICLILLNVLAVILETVPSLSMRHQAEFDAFEEFSVLLFTIEYFLRLWSATIDLQFKHPITGRLRFALRPLPLIDLVAVLPYYLPMIVPMDLLVLRAVRLFRLFRIFKLVRYSHSLETFGHVFSAKKEDLSVTAFMILVLLIIVSSVMYFVERDAQPTIFSSIPATMWWAVVTLTTVGYGDIYPVTTLGKVLASLIAVLGIGMFAIPAGILGSGFVEEVQKRRQHTKTCPHCGKNIS